MQARQSISLIGIAKSVWTTMDSRNLGLIAAGVAFYSVFAVFPGIAATIAFWGFFADPVTIQTLLEVAEDFIPEDAAQLIEGQLNSIVLGNESSIGWTTLVTVGIALYSARTGVAALIQGLNTIEGQSHREGFWRFLAALIMTLTLIGIMLAALTTMVIVPIILALIPLGPVEGWLITALPSLVMFVLILLALGVIYRYGPNRGAERHGWVTWGAALAAILWAAASLAFSIYLANFGSYNRIYGSIGAFVALMMWFYISAYVVLLGAAVNSAIAEQRQGQ